MKKIKGCELNKGFTLVEVLLAIVILGLIAVPILQMFFSSYKINEKSKRMLTAAELAQTTIEALSSQTYEENLTIKGTHVADGLKQQYADAYANRSSVLYSEPGRLYRARLYTIPLGYAVPPSDLSDPSYNSAEPTTYFGPYCQYINHDATLEEEHVKGVKNPATGITPLVPNVKPHQWDNYYFQNIKYPDNQKEKLCARISFDMKEYTEGEAGVIEVRVQIYGYQQSDLALKNDETDGYFCKTNIDAGKFDLLESVSTYIPVKHVD